MVGGDAPIVVQSMTNTDTADVEGTARQVAALARAGSELVRITVDRDEAAAAVPHIKERLGKMGVNVPHRRRFPLHRPQASGRSSGLRRGARQIPHQSRQCRLQEQARPAVLPDRRDGDQIRQAGAHRRQLGLARPGAADPADGRELGLADSRVDAREVTHEAMVQSALLSAARAEEIGLRAEPHHPLGQGVGGAGPDRGLYRARRAAPTMRCISASPKPAWAPRASSPRRPPWACCCSRASATPSAFR